MCTVWSVATTTVMAVQASAMHTRPEGGVGPQFGVLALV